MKSITSVEQCELLLRVFEEQLDTTNKEIEKPARELGSAFESLFFALIELSKISKEKNEIDNEKLAQQCQQMNELIQKCIMALQFTDASSQRISHISNGINLIRNIIIDQDSCESLVAWSELKDKVRQSYSIEDERQTFDHFIQDHDSEIDCIDGKANLNGC